MSLEMEQKQRTLIIQERLKVIAPYVQSLLEAHDGKDWLQAAVRRQELRQGKQVERVSIRDPRYLAALIGFDPVAGTAFSESDRSEAKILTGIFLDLAHPNRQWTPGSDRRADTIVTRLLAAGDAEPAPELTTRPGGPDAAQAREAERARRIDERIKADRAAVMAERGRLERELIERHNAWQRRQEQDDLDAKRVAERARDAHAAHAERARDAHAALHRRYQAELHRWTALPWVTRRVAARPQPPFDWSGSNPPDSKVEILVREYGALLGRELSSTEQDILRQAVRGTYQHCIANRQTPSGAEMVRFLRAWVVHAHGASGAHMEALERLESEMQAIMRAMRDNHS